MTSKNEIKLYLEQTLHKAHAFWSYEKTSCLNLSDHDLIKFVLIYLDLDYIQFLFTLLS